MLLQNQWVCFLRGEGSCKQNELEQAVNDTITKFVQSPVFFILINMKCDWFHIVESIYIPRLFLLLKIVYTGKFTCYVDGVHLTISIKLVRTNGMESQVHWNISYC